MVKCLSCTGYSVCDGCDLEKPFNLDKTVEITSHMRFPLHM